MKKIILLIAMALMLVGCSSKQITETAEQSLNNTLQAIQTQDKDMANKYLKYNELLNLGEFSISTDDSKLFKEVMSNMKYTINNITENEKSAEAEVEILNVNMEVVLEKYLDDYYTYLMDQMNKEPSEQTTKEKMLETMNNRLFEILEEEKENQVTNIIKINMEKKDNKWSVLIDDELKNALTGNLANLFKQIQPSAE